MSKSNIKGFSILQIILDIVSVPLTIVTLYFGIIYFKDAFRIQNFLVPTSYFGGSFLFFFLPIFLKFYILNKIENMLNYKDIFNNYKKKLFTTCFIPIVNTIIFVIFIRKLLKLNVNKDYKDN
ncbi:hypothetical protein SCORR_v1c04270 [Spiroplasma corruscae]|uniref:Uncharacterized protein n=1 Tax=Spiroplasma corruscae TaxID=216934 RepID=A0A222EP77_9MOLU|nr:hypothetical protein [Spiroplasma corruscae]ASP28201.1 hypothetical protein SCORR_v1c04270 [Spiroplasma corruscae]